jgi:hypothetical protein
MVKVPLLKDLTWVEFKGLVPSNPIILLPFGSQEEQGPHAPMGDYMLTDRIAELVAAKSGAIAAPIIPFGYADYFRPVPGGIQLRAETFACCSRTSQQIPIQDQAPRHLQWPQRQLSGHRSDHQIDQADRCHDSVRNIGA